MIARRRDRSRRRSPQDAVRRSALHVGIHVDRVRRVGDWRVEAHRGHRLAGLGRENVGEPARVRGGIPHAGYHSKRIVLIDAGVIRCRFDSAVYRHRRSPPPHGVIVGKVEISILSERRTPTVTNDECAIARGSRGEVVPAVVVVPADHRDGVVRRLVHVDVQRVMDRTEARVVFVPIDADVHRAVLRDRLFDNIVVERAGPRGEQDRFLKVPGRRRCGRRRIGARIVIRVIRLPNRSAPARQVGHRHQ